MLRHCGDGDALGAREAEQRLLREVGVVLDLQHGGADARVAQVVEQQRALVVADTDRAGEAGVDELLHLGPGGVQRRVDGCHLVVGVFPARGVRLGRVDVLEGDREVDVEQVKVLEAPPGELLLRDRRDALGLVEGVPELGHDEELLTRHEAVLDGARDSLAALLLVAVVWAALAIARVDAGARGAHRKRRQRGGIRA